VIAARHHDRSDDRHSVRDRRSPRALGEAEIRAFLDHLVVEKQLSRSSQRVHVAAIRFPYHTTLDRPVTAQRIPFPRREGERLPVILSMAEVEQWLRVPRLARIGAAPIRR
jgi:Phage integrase, N-terminal SAM-like domain